MEYKEQLQQPVPFKKITSDKDIFVKDAIPSPNLERMMSISTSSRCIVMLIFAIQSLKKPDNTKDNFLTCMQ